MILATIPHFTLVIAVLCFYLAGVTSNICVHKSSDQLSNILFVDNVASLEPDRAGKGEHTKDELSGVALSFPDSGSAGYTNTGNWSSLC